MTPASPPSPRSTIARLLLCLLLSVAAWTPALAAKVTARTDYLTLPTYPWTAVKHPYFRGTDKVNIYPYPMLDFLSREKTNRTYRAVVLENEYLRITFLPELGGKIHEVIDKTTGQPMFYVNHVIKPGLIGQCGAWTSGGVEWNTGPQGHTVGCMQPVAVEVLSPEPDGSRSVAIGETERIYGTKWTVVVTVRPGRSFIEERIRIYNPTETIRPYYFWNCTAVPNTPGFRFIYPMTLGTDHGSEKFFNWPIDHGKDLTRGTNYQDASSIFAWHCDQDFFGSYDDSVDRGVVSYANHQQVPGKKAWTWGQGGFGKMHQMDLTDTDGPYNEVQTGPLLTQGEVGRLDPCEAVEWKEWWYPVHGIGGFTFANKELAVNAVPEQGSLRLRLLGTGNWSPVEVRVSKGSTAISSARCKITAREATTLHLELRGALEPLEVELHAGKQTLARFRLPLDLPIRHPAEKRTKSESATDLALTGWQDFLFARFAEAEVQFQKALEKDLTCAAAHTGLAYLNLDRDPATAAKAAHAALEADANSGKAHFALAAAEARIGNEQVALDEAWKASLDPVTAVAGRALAAKVLLRRGDWEQAASTLSAPGPWQVDATCRNRLAFALLKMKRDKQAIERASANLNLDPLDSFARSVVWLAGRERKPPTLEELTVHQAEPILDLVAEYSALGQDDVAFRLVENPFLKPLLIEAPEPLLFYWTAYLSRHGNNLTTTEHYLNHARSLPATATFPCRVETAPVLRWALSTRPADGHASLLLGHLLFSLGRHAEGRELWQQAVRAGEATPIALRALGLAALNLDGEADAAATLLSQAHSLDPADAIIARDLAKVLFTQADKADSPERKKELLARARDTLKAAFAQGKGRSDFVSLLGRAQNRLGEYAETARMLDQVRVTVWEGSREVHDLFEDAHLALGEAHLAAGHPADALADFNRALEYPENLATGKLENTREAHIHYLRGNTLAALGRRTEAVAAWRQAADEPESKDQKKEESRKKAREALRKASTQ